MRLLKSTLYVIGTVQAALGLMFLIAPGSAAHLLGFEPAAPGWVNWLFTMMAARFLGYAYGMFKAARSPDQAHSWIDTMIAIQAIDWIATIGYLAAGDVTLRQVSTASFLPAIFIVVLVWFRPRRQLQTTTATSAKVT
jgi:hypothetical protein